MATWSRNHRACETTWTTLFSLTQLRAVFGESGDLPMSQLTFWTQPGDTRQVRAQTLGTQMDRIFVRLRGAKYEDGVTQAGAISALVASLLDESGTVADLADTADVHYRFFGEEVLDPEDGGA